MITQSLPWISPLEAAAALGRQERCWVLLYSGQQLADSGRYSYLALYPEETVTGDDFALLQSRLSADEPLLENAWFGYSGYEMLHRIETLAPEPRSFITLPDLWFTRFGMILQFDHVAHTVICHRERHILPPEWPKGDCHSRESGNLGQDPRLRGGDKKKDKPHIKSLASSPMRKSDYLDVIAKTKEAILRGDLYQANITRKFTGEFSGAPDAFGVFCALCETSPAAYSAFIRINDTSILSSSPERFLTIDSVGNMASIPIKGTAPRHPDATIDAKLRAQLETSTKDRAENLMIADLMRNDFSRSAEPGSVKVERLFEVSSYATLHHMASTITGRKRVEVSTLEALKHCFPPGSMTGAPKISAMKWCLEQERIRRGVYSGALGWFGGDGSCDFSVVIRTLIIEGRRFEFQVGGGIVADSDPIEEWQETMTKAQGILRALGVDVEKLEKI